MAAYPIRTQTLAASATLPEDATLRHAFACARASGTPILPVGGPGGRRAVLERDLRFALQDHPGEILVVGEIAGPVATSAEEAQARLEADPTLPAVLLGEASSAPPGFLQRVVPEVETAVVMAGGLGKRLRPRTADLPKPLLEVHGRSLLFRILDRLQGAAVRRVFVSVNYLADKVKDAVGDGAAWDLEVRYLDEDEPLDTGAGLVQLGEIAEPFYIVNGDILTDLDFRTLARLHLLSGALATVATYLFPAPLPYGLIHADGAHIRRIEEKPVFRYGVNAGIYMFSPQILDLVPKGQPLAMVDFLNAQAAAGFQVERFPLVEYWNDVGTHEALERAERELADEEQRTP